jgi:hypothetical protein
VSPVKYELGFITKKTAFFEEVYVQKPGSFLPSTAHIQ